MIKYYSDKYFINVFHEFFISSLNFIPIKNLLSVSHFLPELRVISLEFMSVTNIRALLMQHFLKLPSRIPCVIYLQ
uniref:Uncharacterized protein n=1 Tax=Octopus bimaculoides TaxID=37653 RepID=A0A0L8HVL7_OCTBM